MIHFENGLADRPNYIPLLRDLGDVLDRQGDSAGALQVLELGYKLAPRDEFLVPKYCDVLEKNGNNEEALAIMQNLALTYPEKPIFEHRVSTILEKTGQFPEALDYARMAASHASQTLPEVLLHCASMEFKAGDPKRAEDLLAQVPQTQRDQVRRVRETQSAEMKLRSGDFRAARACLTLRDTETDPYCADLLVRVDLEEARRTLAAGRIDSGGQILDRAARALQLALQRFPNNPYLQSTRLNVVRLAQEFDIELQGYS